MHTKRTLTENLYSIGINPQGTLLVHSSTKAIGEVDGGAETVLNACMDYLRDGLLVFPTHTWHANNNKNHIYNPATEPSCIGLLTNLFRRRKGVLRSLHPTHSVAALGKDADEFIAGEELRHTPCSRDGVYGRLYDRRAQVLFLGCTLKSNTIIHGVEEWNQVPGRLSKEPVHYQIALSAGAVIDCAMHRHDWAGGDISLHYAKLREPLLRSGIAVTGLIGDAHSILCEVRPMCDFVSTLLQKDREVFADADAIVF